MPLKRIDHTGTFSAVDKDGKEYTVHEYTRITGIPATRETPAGEMEVGKFLKTSDNQDVNRIDKGKYEIVSVFGNIPLTSDDPHAP
jgi:hypothetical protein